LGQAERNPPRRACRPSLIRVRRDQDAGNRNFGFLFSRVRLCRFDREFNEHAAEIVAVRDPAFSGRVARLRFLSAQTEFLELITGELKWLE